MTGRKDSVGNDQMIRRTEEEVAHTMDVGTYKQHMKNHCGKERRQNRQDDLEKFRRIKKKSLGVVCDPMNTDGRCEIITGTLCDHPDSTRGKAKRKTTGKICRYQQEEYESEWNGEEWSGSREVAHSDSTDYMLSIFKADSYYNKTMS